MAKRWFDNPDAVILADAISHRQCLYRLPYPPFGDLVLTENAFADMVEELVPDDRRRVKALKDIFNATDVKRAQQQIKDYLQRKNSVSSAVK